MSTPSLHVSLECVAVQADEQQLEEHDISHVQCVFHAYRSSHLLLPSGDAAMVMEPTFPYPDGISALPLRLPDVEDESKVRTVYVADGGVAALLPINTVLQDGIHLQIREELSVQVPVLTSPLNTAELSGPMATPLTQAGAQQPLREYHFPCGSPPNITDVISPNPTNADFGAAAEMMEVDAAHNNDDNNHTTYYYYLFCATSLSNSALMSTATSRTSSIASAEEAEAKWGKGSFALGLRAQWSGFLVMDDMHAPTWSAGTAVSMVMRLDPLPVCDAEAAHPIAKAEAEALTTQGMDLRCRVEMRPAMALHDPVDGATITMGSNKDSQSSTVLPQPRSILLKSVSSFSSQKQRITFHTDDDAKEGNAARSRNSSLSMTITSSTLGSSTITTSCSTSSLDEEVAALIEEVGPSTEVLAATTTTGAAVPDPPSPRSVSRYRTSSGPRFSSVVVDVDVSESRPPESEAPHILHDDDDDDGAQSLLHRRVSSLTNSGRSLPSMPPLNPQLLQQGLSGRESVTSDPPVLMGTQHPAEEVQQLPPIVVAGLSSPPASTSVVASNTLPTLIAEEVAPAVVQPPPSADATPLPVNAVVAERVDAPPHSVAVVSLDGSLESDSDPLPIQRELRFSSVEESPGSQVRSSKSSTTPMKVPTPPKGEHQEADAKKEPQQQQQPHEHRRHSLRRRSSAAFLEASASILSHARSDGGEEYGYSYYSYSSSSSSSQHRAALVGTSDRTPPEDGSSDRTFTPSPESSCPSMHPAASSVFPNIGEQLDLCSASAEISAQMMSAIASSTPFTSTPPPHQETLTVDVDRRTSQQPSLSYTSPLLDDDEDGYDASHPRGRRRSGNNMVGTSSISQHNNNNKSDAERSPTTETMTATAPPTARRLSEDNTDALESFLSAPHGATTPPHIVSLPLTSQAAPLLHANTNTSSTSSSSYSHSNTSSPQTSSSAYVGESATMDSYSILPQSSLCLTEENVGLTAFEIQRPKAWSGVRTFVSSATIGGRHVMHSVEGCPHVARTSSSSRRRGGATPRRTVHFEELHNNVEEPPTTKTGLRFLRGCRRGSPTEAVKKHSARTSSSDKRRSAMMHAEMEEKPKRSSSSSQRGKAVVVEERGCLRQLPLVACCRVEPPSHPSKPTTSAATTTPSKTRNASSVSASSRSHHHHHDRHDDDDDEESSPTRSSSTSSTEREFLQRQYSEETTMASVAAEESKGSTVALVAAHMRNLLRSGSPPFREASELHESVAAMLQQEEEPVGMAHEVSNIVNDADVPLFADTAPATARVDAVMEADLPRQESGPACELVAAPAQACVEMLAMDSISLDAAAATIQPQRSLALSTQESEVRPAEEDEEDEREKEMPQEEPQHDHEVEKEDQQHVNEDDGVGSTTTPARAAVESSITSVVVLRHTMTHKAVLRCVWPRTRHARYFSPALPRLFADEVELPRLHAWEAEPPEEVLPPATPLTKMFSATSVRRGFVFAEVDGLERIAQILATQMPSRSHDDDDDDDETQLRLALYSADRELLATSSTLHLPIASSSSSRIHRWSDILCLPPRDLDALPASMFVELQRRVLRLITHAPPPPMPPTTSSSSLEVPKQDDDDGVVLTATTNTGEEVMSVVPQLSPISTAVLADDLSPPPRPLPNAASRSSSTHTHGDVELRTPAVVASHLSSSSFSSYHSHATTTTPAPHAHDHDDAPPALVVAPPPPPDVREESSVWGSTNSSVAQAQEAAVEVVADDDHENENDDDDGDWEEFTDDDAPVPITTPQLPSAQDVQIPSRDVAADVAEVVVGDVVVAPSDVVVVSVQRALPSASPPPPPPVAEHFDALQHTELHHVEAVWVSLATSAIIPADDLRHDAPTPTTKSVALTATHASSSSSSSTSLRAGEYLANLMYALGSCSSIYTPAAEQLRPICDAIRTRAEATLRAPTQSSSSSSCVLHPRTLTTSPVTMLVESLPRHQHSCNAPPTTSLVGVRGDHLTTAANLSSAYSVVVRASTVLVDVLPSVAPHTPQPQVSLHISGGRDGILGSSTTHNNNKNECGSPVISLRCNVQTLLTVDAPSILITATSSIAEEIFVAHAHVNVFDVMEKLGHTHVRVHRGEKWLPLHASPPHNNNNNDDDDDDGGGGGASLRRCRVGWVHVDYECRPVEILKEHLSCLRGESTTTQRDDDDDDDDELIDVSVMEATGLALPTNANVLSGVVNAYCEMNVVRRPCNPIHNNNDDDDDDDDDESSIKCAPAITTTALNCGGEPRWGHTFRAYMNNIHQLCVRVAHRECADVHPSSTSTPLGCVVVGPYQIQRIMRSLRAQIVGHVADDASSPPPHVVLWMPIFLRAATLTRCGPQRWREPPAHINGALLLIFSFANTNAHHRHHYDVRRFMMREWSCLSTAHVGCYGSRTTIHGSQPLLPSSTQHDEHDDDDDVAWLRLSEMRVVWPWLLHVGSSSLRLHLTTPSGTSDYSLRTQKQDDDDDDDDVDGATFVVMEDVLIPATPVMEWSVYRRSRLMHDDDDDDELLGCGRWAVRDASSRARLARMPPVEATVVVEMMPVELNASQHLESGYLTHHLTTFPSIANMMKDAHTSSSSSWRWPGVGTAAIMELRVLDYVGIDASGAPHADDVGVLVSEAPQSHRGNVAEQWLEGLGGADVPRTDARNILPCHHRRHHKSDDDDDGASVLRLEWPARPFAWCSRPPPTLRLYIVELQQQQQKSARDDDDDAPRLPAHGLALLPHLKAFRNNVGRCWLPLLQPREDGAECVGFIKMSYRHNLVKHNTHDDDDDDDDDDVVLPDYLVEVSLGPLQCRQSLVDAAQILVGIDAYVVRVDARDGGSVVLPCAGRGCRMLRMQLTSSDAPSPLAYARLRVAQAADDDDVVVMSRSDGVVVGDVRVRWRRVEANAPTTSPACAHVASWCTAPQPHTQQIIAASEAQRLRDTATATTTTTWENHDDVAHLPRAQTYLRLMHVKWANGVGGVASSLRDVVGNIATRVVVRCRQRPDNTTTTTTTTTTTSSSRQDDDDDDRHESVDLTELCGIGAIDATTSASVSWPDAQPLILALPRRGVDVELEACVYVSDATSTSPDVCVLRGVADYHGGLCRPMLMRVALHPHETWSAHIGRGVACGDVEMMVEEIHSLVPTTTTTTTNMMKEVDEVSQTKTSTDGLSADASYLAEESGGEASMSSAMMLMEVRIVALELVGVHAEKQWEVGTQVVVKVRDASVAGRQPVVLRAQRCTSAQGGLCWVGDVCQPAGSIMTVEVRVGGGMHVLRTTANQGSGVFSHSSASTATSIHHHQQQQQQLHVPQLVYGGTSALHGEGSITVPQNLRHHPDANTCVMREIIMDALGTCVLGNMCVELRAVASTETSYAATELFFHRVAHVRLRDCVGLIRGDVQQLHQDVLAYQRLQHRCLMQHTHKGRVGRALRRRLAEARRCVEQSTSTYTQQPQQHTLWLEVGTNNENVLMNVRRSANFGIPTAATLLHRRGERVAAPLRFTADVCWPTTTRDASLRLQLVSGNAHDDDEDDDASSTIIADGVMDLRPPPAVFRRPQRRRRWHTLPTLVGGGEISVMAEVAWSTAVRRGGLRAHFLFLRPSPTCSAPRYPCVRLTYHFDADGSEVAQYLPLHNNNNNNNDDDDVYDAGNGVWCLASTLLPRVGCIGGRVVRVELLDLIPSSGERAEAEVFLGQHAWTSADEEALQHAQTSPDAHRTWWLRFVRDDVRGTTEYYELLCCVSANVGEEAPQHDDAPTSWSTCCSLEIISMDARLTTSKVAVDGWTNNVSVACTTQLQPTTSTTTTTSPTQPHVCAMMLRLDHVLVDAHHLRFVFFSAELTQTFVAFASVRQLVANMAHEGTTPLHLYTCIHDEDDAVGMDEGATCVGEVFVRWRMHPPQLVPMSEAVRSTEETLAEERRVWGSDDVLDDLFSTTETAVVEDEAVRNMEQTQAWMDQLDEVARQCAEELLATWSWQVMRVEVEGLHLPRIHAPEMMAARPSLQRAVAMRDDVDAATTHDAPRRILAQLAYPVVAENNNNDHDDQDHDDVLQRVGVCSTTASISAAAAFGATFSPLPWVLPLRELQQQLSRTHAHLSLWEVLPHTQGPHTALLLATLPLRAVLAELWCISTTAMRENGVVATATSPMAPPPRPSTLTTEWMSTDDANTMHSTRVRLTFASPWSRMAADKAISTPQEADEMMHLIAAKEPRTLVAELRDIRVNLSANTAKTNAQQRYGLIVLVPEAHMRHTTTLHECANMDDDATTTTTSLLQVHLQPRTPLLSWRTTPQAGATYVAHVYLVELHAHVSDGSFARTDVVRLCGQQRISLEQLSLTTSATVQEIAMDLLRGEGRLTMHLSLASVSGTARSSAAMLREAAMRQRHPELEMLFAAQHHHQHDYAGAPAFALLGSSLVFGHAVAAGAVVCGAPQPTCVGGHMKDLHACSGISEMHWPHTTTRRATATTAPSSLVVPPLPRNMAEWVVEEVLDARGASPAVLLRGRTGHVVVPFITHDGSTAMLIEGGLQHGMKADVIPAQQQQQQHVCITPALPCLYFPRRRHLVQLMWPRGSTHDASMAYHGHTATLVGGAVWMLGGFASALANLPAASSLVERIVPTRPTQPRNDDDGGRRGLVQKRRDEIQRMKMRTHTGHRRVVRRSRTPANPNRLRHTAASAPVAAHAAANDDDGDDVVVLDAAPPSPSTPLTMAFSTDVRCALIDTTTAEVSPCVRVPPLPHNTSHTPGAAGAHAQRGCWIALDAPPAVAMHVAMRISSVVLLHGGLTESATSSASINISDDLVAFDTLRLRWWRWERPTTQPWPVARFGHATVALPATTDDDEDDCCSAFLIFGGASTMAEVVPLADMLWVLKCAPDDATRMKEAPPLRPSWTCVRVSACSPLRSRVMANLLVYRHAPHTTAAVADEERANVSDFGRCLLLVCGGVDERSSWETNAKSQQQQHDDDDDVATSIHAADAYTNCVERWLGAPRLGSVLLECIVAPEGGSGQTTAALVVPS